MSALNHPSRSISDDADDNDNDRRLAPPSVEEEATHDTNNRDHPSRPVNHLCTICEIPFSSKSNRVRHERTAHGNVRFACPICEKDLSSNERVKKHMSRCVGLNKHQPVAAADGSEQVLNGNNRFQLNIEDTSRITENGHTNPAKAIPDVVFELLSKPFLFYLKQTPTTATERTIIQRRLTNAGSQEIVVSSTRYILGVLVLYGRCPLSQLSLRLFVRVDACKLLQEALDARGVCAGRVHQMFLLVSKVLLWITHVAKFDYNTIIHPEQLPSWYYVRNVCEESCREKKKTERGLMPKDNVMTIHELGKVVLTTMEKMSEYVNRGEDAKILNVSEALHFSRYLFTCTLGSIPAPRSQIMRHLQIGSTFIRNKRTENWQIRYNGSENSKNGAPLLLNIPAELSKVYDEYISSVRAVIVREAVEKGIEDQSYVFPNTATLGPRDEFGTWTKLVTASIIRKAVSPHKFRHSMTQAFYDKGASMSDMNELAEMMQHSSQVQARYYRVPRFEQQSSNIASKLRMMYRRDSDSSDNYHLNEAEDNVCDDKRERGSSGMKKRKRRNSDENCTSNARTSNLIANTQETSSFSDSDTDRDDDKDKPDPNTSNSSSSSNSGSYIKKRSPKRLRSGTVDHDGNDEYDSNEDTNDAASKDDSDRKNRSSDSDSLCAETSNFDMKKAASSHRFDLYNDTETSESDSHVGNASTTLKSPDSSPFGTASSALFRTVHRSTPLQLYGRGIKTLNGYQNSNINNNMLSDHMHHHSFGIHNKSRKYKNHDDSEDSDDVEDILDIFHEGSKKSGNKMSHSNNLNAGQKADQKRILIRWNEAEIKALAEGVEKHGKGKWVKILKDEEFASRLKRRTPTQLRAKFNSDKKTDKPDTDANDKSIDDIGQDN